VSKDITIDGGYTAVETETFRAAARSLATAADLLVAAGTEVARAHAVLLGDGSLVAVDQPWSNGAGWQGSGGSALDPGPWGGAGSVVVQAAADDAHQVTVTLTNLRSALDHLRTAVLKAGRIYEESESFVARAWGGVVDVGARIAPTARAVVALDVAAVSLGAKVPNPFQPVVQLESEAARRYLPHWTGGATIAEGMSPWVPGLVDRAAPWIAAPGAGVEGAAGSLADLYGEASALISGDGLVVRQATTAPDGTALADLPAPGTAERALLQVKDVSKAAGQGTVAIQRLGPPDDPRYVVTIPGTEDWLPGDDPLDLTSDLQLIGGHADDVSEEVERAMADAGVPPDAPVVLVGHSLGGIAAARLAASTSFRARYDVAAVITAGSPIGRIDVPSSTSVLSVENEKEYVSNLEGARNPSGPNRITVHAGTGNDVVERAGRDGVPGAHSVETHAGVLAEARAEHDPALDRMLSHIDALVDPGDDPTTTSYFQAQRGPDPASARVPTPEPGPAPSPTVGG
jgi:hypothetical protein